VEKSIAVLPFENFSEEKENAHFADGIQDDILTSLAKIGDLKVISRTSVMGYRGKTHNLRQIGRELGVATVLEGSVRRVGNRVRINVQLINAETDEHIWAEDYDRDLTDVFSIQSELAQKIAAELRAQLSPEEKVQVTRKPTENGEAYLAFVEAQNLHAEVQDHRSCSMPSGSTNVRFSWTRSLRSPARASPICRAGSTRRTTSQQSGGSVPEISRSARSLCSRTCRRRTSRSATLITTAIAITCARWRSSASRSAGCRITRVCTWQSPRSSAGRADGRNAPPTSRKRSSSARRTPG
jgi:TolB-like protein